MQRIGIIGIGKLGICFALNAERKGLGVLAADINPITVSAINSRVMDSDEPMVSQLLAQSRLISASGDIRSVLAEDVDMIFLFVATPSLLDGGYDHMQVERIATQLVQAGVRSQQVNLIVGCTTMPGYCDTLAEKLRPFNYTVSYCPEFIAQGSIMHDQINPDQVLIGEGSKKAGDAIEAFYRTFCENEPIFCRMDRTSAEIAKIATNCFLTTKISFANSIGDLALKAGANPDAILHAVGADSRIGNKYLRYGFGFGGPCFPRDNRALGKFGDDIGYELLLSKATDEVNRRHLEFQFEQMMQSEDPVLFEHVTYKKGSSITEESQQLALAIMLARAGKKVIIRDTHSVVGWLDATYPGLFILEPHRNPETDVTSKIEPATRERTSANLLPENAICTICTHDHLFKVQALFHSLRGLTNASFHCLITDSDEIPTGINDIEFLTISGLKDHGVESIQARYSGDRLRWACKPILLNRLLSGGKDRVIYLDNDICFYRSPDFIFDLLAKRSVILTPHYYPTDPDRNQHWLESNFRVGLYNAGFVGVNRSGEAAMRWWANCCRYNVKKSAWRGLFDDQKYLDLMPVIFNDVLVLQHHGCNVAGWNTEMSPRSLREDGTLALAHDWPLVFAHFNPFTMREIERGRDPLMLPMLRAYENTLRSYRSDYSISTETGLRAGSLPLIARHLVWKLVRALEA